MDSIPEYRQFTSQAEIRAQGRTIVGYAALFGSESLDLGGFTEVIEPGAFASSLARDLVEEPILLLWGHDSNQPLASTRPGTLALWEDVRGLAFRAKLPPTSWASDALEATKAGLVGTSFGFRAIKDSWDSQSKRRRLLDVYLHEVSLVTIPAYPATLGQQSVRANGGRQLVSDTEFRRIKLRLHKIRGG